MKSLKYYSIKTIIILFTILISNDIYAQNISNESVKKATLLSAACPGLGQVYNKKYWKLPVIYASLGGTIYYYIRNNNKYHEYKSAYIYETDNDNNTPNNSGYTASNLITLQNYYRDSRDLSGLLFFLVYFLNIVDASVDAHLTNYNVNDNLSLYLKPTQIDNNESINLCLKFNL